MKQYLGLQITHSHEGIKLSQRDFIDKLLDSMGMSDCNPMSTLIDPGLIIDDLPDPAINLHRYQHITGSLQWLASHIQPNIARAATLLAQFNTKPTPTTVSAYKRVLAYLKGTRHVRINFKLGSDTLPRPIAYTDADWGRSLNARTPFLQRARRASRWRPDIVEIASPDLRGLEL